MPRICLEVDLMRAIIVLGNRLINKSIHAELKGRIETGIRLLGGGSVLILSGGRTNSALNKTEAEVMWKYCVDSGIEAGKLVKEENALDTIGNAYFTKLLIDKLRNVNEVIVVSSCYHMERVKFVFHYCYGSTYKLSFEHCFAYPAESNNEAKSLESAKNFFKGIMPGDMEAIKQRLFTGHSLYKKS